MWPSIADTYRPKPGEQLPLVPVEPRKRQAPLRSCGRCAGSFRSWKKDALCGRCTDDGTPRSGGAAGPATVELDTPTDDGSLHYLMTGQPEPPAAA